MLGEIKVQETETTDCVHVGRLPNYSPSAPCAHLDVYFWSDDAGPAHDDGDAVAAGGGVLRYLVVVVVGALGSGRGRVFGRVSKLLVFLRTLPIFAVFVR